MLASRIKELLVFIRKLSGDFVLFLSLLATGRCVLASRVRPPLRADSPSHILVLTDSSPPPPRQALPSSPRSVLTQIKVSRTSVPPGCCLGSPAGLGPSVRPPALSDRRCVGAEKKPKKAGPPWHPAPGCERREPAWAGARALSYPCKRDGTLSGWTACICSCRRLQR